MRIAVVAPACPLDATVPERIAPLIPAGVSVEFHPQCFASWGHFAGTDEERCDALVAVANDPDVDAVWFARGGYGSNRIAQTAIERMGSPADEKRYLGYSDLGFLLAGLDRNAVGQVAHGPMPADVNRPGGEDAVVRALTWLSDPQPDRWQIALNLTVLSQLLGSNLEPSFKKRILIIEEVSEYHYRIDRSFFHITSQPSVRRAAGIMLGRCSIPENDRPFFQGGIGDEETIARYWCEKSGIPYLGRADIGHDVHNKVVPFG